MRSSLFIGSFSDLGAHHIPKIEQKTPHLWKPTISNVLIMYRRGRISGNPSESNTLSYIWNLVWERGWGRGKYGSIFYHPNFRKKQKQTVYTLRRAETPKTCLRETVACLGPGREVSLTCVSIYQENCTKAGLTREANYRRAVQVITFCKYRTNPCKALWIIYVPGTVFAKSITLCSLQHSSSGPSTDSAG